jgi:hypothetical protein
MEQEHVAGDRAVLRKVLLDLGVDEKAVDGRIAALTGLEVRRLVRLMADGDTASARPDSVSGAVR